ncbi:hypothetical protein [Mesobacillus foraminis]|uniref:Uncharacterized protein n=1 Tax=Mesobacillus foraminis TaxID=279826 RepID=A0A4R2B852_9BACI|nr:hypothetical protein [Mesobacillus foraminis]TCN22252.1 hypothetical protein EV146_11189 [Mesobacillus foraminis]
MPRETEERGKVGEFYVPYAREKRKRGKVEKLYVPYAREIRRKREGRIALRALCPRNKKKEGR